MCFSDHTDLGDIQATLSDLHGNQSDLQVNQSADLHFD